MVIYEIEMRKAAQDKAFDLLEEVKELGHKKKMVLCELEDTLYECFESTDNDDENEYDREDEYTPFEEEQDMDVDYRKRGGYRYGSRRNMRIGMRSGMRSAMHMRRNKMGRFV